MPFEPGLIGYAALASLSLSQSKHRPAPSFRFIPSSAAAKPIGISLLLLSALSAWLLHGPALGSVTWLAQLSVAAVALVLLMSWRPLWAFALAGISAVVGIWGTVL